jgi:hypothetical protein
MFFSFWGLKGVGEREFFLFFMCSHQSYVGCNFRTKGEIWHQFAKRKNNVSKEQIQWEYSLKRKSKNNSKGNESRSNLT